MPSGMPKFPPMPPAKPPPGINLSIIAELSNRSDKPPKPAMPSGIPKFGVAPPAKPPPEIRYCILSELSGAPNGVSPISHSPRLHLSHSSQNGASFFKVFC